MDNNRTVLQYVREGGVIVGRNGAVILADRPHTFHVLLTGSVEDRVARAAERAGSAPAPTWCVPPSRGSLCSLARASAALAPEHGSAVTYEPSVDDITAYRSWRLGWPRPTPTWRHRWHSWGRRGEVTGAALAARRHTCPASGTD